jgi:hypothetical protein
MRGVNLKTNVSALQMLKLRAELFHGIDLEDTKISRRYPTANDHYHA